MGSLQYFFELDFLNLSTFVRKCKYGTENKQNAPPISILLLYSPVRNKQMFIYFWKQKSWLDFQKI